MGIWQALHADPHHPEATYNRGLLFWRSGHITDDELVGQLEEARTTHQDDWKDRYLLGLVHMERADAEAATKVLEDAANQALGVSVVRFALDEAKKGVGKWCSLSRTFKLERRIQFLEYAQDANIAICKCQDGPVFLVNLEEGEMQQISDIGFAVVRFSAGGR